MNINHAERHQVNCSQCKAAIMRLTWNYGKNRPILLFFCDNKCKGDWQRAQREALGFTRDWLIDQYITLGRSANDIAHEIGRNSKRVWEWIIDYGIPTRPRGHNQEWLIKDGSAFRGHNHTQELREAQRQRRLADGHVPYLKNGIHWLKSPGAKHPSWKGGLTPERQTFYSSQEWTACVKAVWKRDNATCQRCKLDSRTVLRGTIQFHIHHIDSFSIRERRAVVNNLVLLCYGCHKWVHSLRNKTRLFLGKGH